MCNTRFPELSFQVVCSSFDFYQLLNMINIRSTIKINFEYDYKYTVLLYELSNGGYYISFLNVIDT